VARTRPKAASGPDHVSAGHCAIPRVRFAYPGYMTPQCVARIRPKAASGPDHVSAGQCARSPGALRLPGQHNLAMRSPDKAEGRIRARPRSRGTLRPFPRVRFAYPGYTTSQCVARIRPKAASGANHVAAGHCARSPGALRLPGLHDLAMRSPDKAKGRIRARPRIRRTLRHSPGALRLPGLHDLAMRSPDKAKGRIRGQPRSRGTLRPVPRVRVAYPGYTTSQCVARIRPKAASGPDPVSAGHCAPFPGCASLTRAT